MSKLEEICAKFALKVPAWSDLPPGWAGLLESALKEMLEAGWKGHLEQVKEKFGGLRIYYNMGEPEDSPLADVDDLTDDERELWNMKIVSKAEKESFKTCQDCGQPGQLLNNSGWLMTLCSKCFQNRSENE